MGKKRGVGLKEVCRVVICVVKMTRLLEAEVDSGFGLE